MHPIKVYVVVIVVPFFPFYKHESVLMIWSCCMLVFSFIFVSGIEYTFLAILFIFLSAEIQQVEHTSVETNSVKGIMETEIQQVEQTSVETNSAKAMKTGIQQVEQNSGPDSVKGKKLTTKRGTKPPLNFLAILNDANKIQMIDASSPDELCDKLYAGVFLEENKLASSISIFPASHIHRWNIITLSVHISY